MNKIPTIQELKEQYPKKHIAVELDNRLISDFLNSYSIDESIDNLTTFLKKFKTEEYTKDFSNIKVDYQSYDEDCRFIVSGDRLETDVEYNKRIDRINRTNGHEFNMYLELKEKF